MKLHVIVAPRHDLDFIIEEEYTDIKSNISVYDLVSELAQTPNITEKSITVIVDGAVVPFNEWKKYFLSEEKNHEIKFILEPEGTIVMFAFVFIAMVATFLYTMRMMHGLNSKTGVDKSGESRSIYDVNAQGNKIKLGDVIPEQFGHFKKFPDYLADAHSFYRDNEYYLDLILSQGIGYFQHDKSNIYVGATPLSVLQGVQCDICEPSADLSHNSIAPEITKCWYNSTEVTSSGHTLHALTSEAITTSTHLEYQSIFIEGYDLSKYRVGDLVKISGAENEWVVLPAFQDTTEHYPEQISGDWTIRCQKNYRNCFDHPHQFAVYPFKQVEMMEADAQSPLPQHTYYHIYAFQRDFYVDGNPDPVLRLFDIPANEISIAESARRWGGEKWELNSAVFSSGAWYPSTDFDNYMLLGNNCRHEYWSSGGWIPITEYSIFDYWQQYYSYSGGPVTYGTVDLQTIPDNCKIDCYRPWGMNAGSGTSGSVSYQGRYGELYQQTATYSYKGTPLCYELKVNSGDGTYKLWNSRIKTGAKFRVWAGYCGRVKVVKCHRKDLEGKTVDIMSSGLGVSDGILMELAGVLTHENSAYSTEWININKLCFSLPKIGKQIMSVFDYEQVGASLVPTGAGGNWASKYDPEFSPEEQDKDWEFIVSQGKSYEVAAVQEHGFGHNCVAVRVTATPKGIWDFYDEDRGTVDDNGYYKVVAVYGENSFSADLDSPILVNSKSNLSSDNAKRLFTTPHQNHRVYNSDIMRSDKDYKGREFTDIDQYFKQTKIGGKWEDAPCYAPSVTKVMLHRCDSNGNLYPDWTGFWAVDSIQKNVVVENITQGFSTKDVNNSICGPYRAAPIGVDVSEIEVDLYAPGGIYRRNDSGDIESYYVTVRIEYQRKGDLEWQHRDVTLTSNGIKKFINGEYTSTGMDAVGVTEKFELEKGDWYFRCYRLTEEHSDDTTHYSDVVKWTGLKSVIANPQSYDDITVLLMRFKGSETLSELSDNQISTLFTRMLPNIETNVLEPTSALAPAVKYICDHSKFASLLHIDNIVDMDAIWNVRGLDLNGTLDSDNTLLNVLSDILHIGYSELSTRADGLQIVQIGEHPNIDYEGGSWDNDHLSGPTDFSFIFSPQNYSNLKIDVALPRRDDAEEIEVQYTDVETYKTATVYIHMSSSQYSTIEVTDYPTSIYQEKLQLFGVTEKAQAVAMGARRLRTILRNRIKFTLTTEFDSLNCNYKDFVGLVVDEPTCGMLTAEMRHKPNYGNEYVQVSSNWAGDGYSGRVTNYSNGIITINPPLTAEQYGGSGRVSHRPTAFFITDEEGQPHLLSINYSDWINAKSFRATLPVTWYGTDIELPRIVSAVIIPCWVEKIKPSEKNCTVELTMYDSSIFKDDLPMREGYGVSAYGTSPYGKSY